MDEIADNVAVILDVPAASAILALPTERLTVGWPLITNALLDPNELAAPGLAKVKVAALPAPSLIVPPFKANELVAL